MYSNNHFKLRSKMLQKLGFPTYRDYLSSQWWITRRREFEASHPARCRYCGGAADDLHHKTYKRLGAELDADLEWVCRDHHAEVHTYGFVGRPTQAMKVILQGCGYIDRFIDLLTFRDAFNLIARMRAGTRALADDPEVIAVLLGDTSNT
jgi:hypothetical protein